MNVFPGRRLKGAENMKICDLLWSCLCSSGIQDGNSLTHEICFSLKTFSLCKWIRFNWKYDYIWRIEAWNWTPKQANSLHFRSRIIGAEITLHKVLRRVIFPRSMSLFCYSARCVVIAFLAWHRTLFFKVNQMANLLPGRQKRRFRREGKSIAASQSRFIYVRIQSPAMLNPMENWSKTSTIKSNLFSSPFSMTIPANVQLETFCIRFIFIGCEYFEAHLTSVDDIDQYLICRTSRNDGKLGNLMEEENWYLINLQVQEKTGKSILHRWSFSVSS